MHVRWIATVLKRSKWYRKLRENQQETKVWYIERMGSIDFVQFIQMFGWLESFFFRITKCCKRMHTKGMQETLMKNFAMETEIQIRAKNTWIFILSFSLSLPHFDDRSICKPKEHSRLLSGPQTDVDCRLNATLHWDT